MNHPSEPNLNDVDNLDFDIDEDFLTRPTIGLGPKLRAAAAEYGQIREGVKIEYEERSKRLNNEPQPGHLLSVPNHLFPRNISSDDPRGLILAAFAIDFDNFATKMKSFVRHRPRGWHGGRNGVLHNPPHFNFGPEKEIRKMQQIYRWDVYVPFFVYQELFGIRCE